MSKQEKKSDLAKEKNQFPRMKTRKKLPLFLNLTIRLSSFLFLFVILLSVFFLIGNNQSFLDENLVLILNFIAVTSIALLIFSVSGLSAGIYYIVKTKSLGYLAAAITFFFLALVAIVMTTASLSVGVLSEGL